MKICDWWNCDREAKSKNAKYCKMHYNRDRRGADMNAPPQIRNTNRICSVDGCEGSYHAKDLCQKHYLEKWVDDNREHVQEDRRIRHEENYEKDIQYLRDWRVKNPDYGSEYSRRYYEEHTEQRRESNRLWCENNRDRVREMTRINTQKRRARLNDLSCDDNITLEGIRELDGNNCAYCSVELDFGSHGRSDQPFNKATIDHVYPVSLGGGLVWENVVLACKRCNSSKRDRILFVEWHPKVINLPQRVDKYLEVIFENSSLCAISE